MKNEKILKNYISNFNKDIKIYNDIVQDDKARPFFNFSHPKLAKEFINCFNDYTLYYYYGAKHNEYIKHLKLDSLIKELVYNPDSKISMSITFIALKESQSKIKKNITLLNKTFSEIGHSKKNSYEFSDLGFCFTVYYSYFKEKTIISLKKVFLKNGKLLLEEHNKFIISIISDNKIKIFNKFWRSLTINFLEQFENKKDSPLNSFKLSLIAEAFKLNDNNEFIANDLIYQNQFKDIDFPKVPLKVLRKTSSKRDLFIHIYGYYYKIFNTISWRESVLFSNSLKLVKPTEHTNLLRFYSKTKLKYPFNILFRWYKEKLNISKYSEEKYIYDYIKMVEQLGLCVNLNISSIKGLINERNILAEEIALKKANDSPHNDN